MGRGAGQGQAFLLQGLSPIPLTDAHRASLQRINCWQNKMGSHCLLSSLSLIIIRGRRAELAQVPREHPVPRGPSTGEVCPGQRSQASVALSQQGQGQLHTKASQGPQQPYL